MVNLIQGTLHRKLSEKISKWIILGRFFLTICTRVHDPIHRQLIEDIDIDQIRIWCFIRYSSSIDTYNTFIEMFHALVPFLINIFSSLWIILSIARRRRNLHPDQSFGQHFIEQIYQHGHSLIATFLLIILALPRLIISFATDCMRSARQPWLYLFAYFLSFIPSILIFIIFVLPSTVYKRQCNMAVRQALRRFYSSIITN